MALTHYLSQSVLGVTLFYGIGLGLGPRWGMAGVLGACVLIFGTQVLLSHLWLARFRYGPLEWLWRWMTYGGPPPQMRQGPDSTPEPEAMRPRPGATSESASSLGRVSREEGAAS
jgi:uncharacterized protein